MTTTPHQTIKRGSLFIVPVGAAIADAPPPAQMLDRAPEFSLWVHGQIVEPGLHMDRARMSTHLYREVRDDLTRFSPVEVTRSAIRRSSHAYVGVIDSRGTPYYFALDSRGVSVREADDAAWKAFDRLADDEHAMAVKQRRTDAAGEMRQVDHELRAPLVVTKGLKYGKKVDWSGDVPHSSWWRGGKRKKPPKESALHDEGGAGEAEKSDAASRAAELYVSEYRRVGHELWLQAGDGESELDPPDDVDKALPKKNKDSAVKKTPNRKASKKQGGAGGKTRYTYPQEKGKPKAGAAGQVPLVVTHDDTKRADPGELANQLGVSIRTLQRTARRLGGDRFATFMRSRLNTFAAKHRLDPDYWNTLYAALMASPHGELAKSDDAAAKKFGDDVKTTAASVPADHGARFGDRKVFIHHVHHEMKRYGLYSGSLDKFKNDVVAAHQKQHLVAARADLVAAMDSRHVSQSETKADGATFHFISDSKHDPEAVKKLAASRKPGSSKPKTPSKSHQEAAHNLSQEAATATAHAEKVRTPEAHLAAMALHHQAGAQHQKASGKVNSKAALAHFDQSVAHLKAAKARG
jgi:hypothetical protein